MKGKMNNGFQKPAKRPYNPAEDFGFVPRPKYEIEADEQEELEAEAEGSDISDEGVEIHTPEEQRRIWGNGPDKMPYEQSDYDTLDNIYFQITSDLRRGGSLNSKQIYHFRNVAKWSLERDRCIAQGDVKNATAYVNMIDKTLAGESLRKKDEKPLENFRIDDLVLKFQKAGLMDENGRIYDLETCQNVIADIMMRRKYVYTKDCADQMLMMILNCIRANEGMSEYPELPPEFRMIDTGEFAPEPNEEEKTAYREIGLSRMIPIQPDLKSGEE